MLKLWFKNPIRKTKTNADMKRVDDIQSLGVPQEVDPDSLEPKSCPNGSCSENPLRCRVQNGNCDCVPQGVVVHAHVHAVHIPHHMTRVLGHGQGDSAVEQL